MRAAGLLVLLAAPAAAQTLHYEGSAGLATGTYLFTERTSSWTIATGLAFGAGPVTLRASLPVFCQSTALAAAPGMSTAGCRWAAGDPLFSASLSGLRAGRLGILLGVSAKVPVVDTTSLGTGAWDAGGSVSAFLLLGGTAMVSVDAGYWHLGDPPGLELTDPLVFGGTLSWLAGRWGLSAGVAGSTPAIAGFAPPVSVTAGVLRLGSFAGFGLLATAGLTETAPDVSVALTWRLGLLD